MGIEENEPNIPEPGFLEVFGGHGDVDCNFIARGETEEELFRKALEHGKKAHGMTERSPELKEKMRKLIREEKAA